MNIIKYPCDESVNDAVNKDEPLLAVISFDGREAIVSHIDDAVEHHVLLANAGRKSTDTDKFFRVVFDRSGADWTFICPPDYKEIAHKVHRIEIFYKDGFSEISEFLYAMGYVVGINIPKRYRRHFEVMTNDEVSL